MNIAFQHILVRNVCLIVYVIDFFKIFSHPLALSSNPYSVATAWKVGEVHLHLKRVRPISVIFVVGCKVKMS